jgi:DNA polymerase-3 subunit gamma/tau
MADDAASAADRYVVVARRYRPRGFNQLVGQDHVAKALANAIQTNRVGHAYLFTGARGVGKTSTARIFAKALNAPGGPSLTPDPSSDVSQAIDAGEDIDVLEIDGASNRGIDEIRQLRSGVGVRPSRSRYKIYIIDEVHMLTTAAFNALLKTLEEPPEHVKFIFCTTDPEKIPITVLSRCQRFDFAPVRVEQIADRLREIVDAEGAQADDEALRLLARRAAGSMRDSQSLLEQMLSFSSGPLSVDLVHSMLGTADDARIGELADALAMRDGRRAMEIVDRAILAGVDPGQLAEQLLGFFRDMMAATVGCDAEMLRFCGAAMYPQLVKQGTETGLQTILGIVGLLDQTLVRIRQSVHAQVLLEAAVVQICSLPDLQAIATLANGLAGMRGSRLEEASAKEKKKAKLGLSATRGPGQPVPPPKMHRSAAGADPPNEHVSAASTGSAPPGPAATGPAGTNYSSPSGTGSAAPSTASGIKATAPAGSSAQSVPSAQPVTSDRSATGTQSGTVAVRRESSANGASPAATGAARPGRESSATIENKLAGQSDPEAERPIAIGAPWNDQSAGQIWRAALAAMDDLTADFARQAVAIAAIDDNRLRLSFEETRELAKQSCERPERKSKLEAAIKKVSARDVLVECVTCAVRRSEEAAPKPSAAVSRRQRMRDAEQQPGVRQVMELFDAEIIRVDEPRSE